MQQGLIPPRSLSSLLDLQIIHDLSPQRFYSQVHRYDGDFRGTSSNIAFAAKMVSDDLAVITTDFTDKDDLYPTSSEACGRKHVIDSCGM